jgi:protein-S-isoprenylcysteine O-methyltransferase Ste14
MLIMPLFPTSFEVIIFTSLIFLWILAEIIGGGIIPKLRRSGEAIKRKDNDNGSNLILRVSLYISVVIAFLFAGYNLAMLPDWFFYPGVVLMIIGILVRQWAIFILGRYFTLTISVQKNQKIVDYGPYRFIRHPTYLGMLLTVVGIGVMLRSWGGILVIIVMIGLAIGYRIHIEEKFLVSDIGDDYIRYMKRTKKLIPFVI